MGDRSKVSYKIYGLGKAKHVDFHGKSVLPLYIQVVFDRNNTIFKSYYFDLFSKTSYVSSSGQKITSPSLKEIENIESATIEYIIKLLGEDFTLDAFKKAYKFYSLDLCHETERGFIDYMRTYFEDEGLPSFANAITNGLQGNRTIDLVDDLSMLFSKSAFEKFMTNSIYYAPPYLPINSFALKMKAMPFRFISVREWEEGNYVSDFDNHLAKSFTEQEQQVIKKNIEAWIDSHRKDIFL